MTTASTAATPATAILADPTYRKHDTGAGHPERPERYDAVVEALTNAGLMKSLAASILDNSYSKAGVWINGRGLGTNAASRCR